MKSNFFPKLILVSVLSMLIYSCTADDVVVTTKKDTVLMKTGDTITQPGTTNPKG